MLKKILFLVNLILILSISSFAQEIAQKEKPTKRKNRYVVLPATAYTPETGLTAGFLSAIVFDLAQGDTLSRMSQVALLGVITTKGQLSSGVDFTLFTKKEQFRFEGRIEFRKDVDRNFGIGNAPLGLIHEFGEEELVNRYNFMEMKTQRYEMRLGAFRKLRQGLFAGLLLDYRDTWNYEPFENRVFIEPHTIQAVPVNGRVLGVGLGLTYDKRDNINNASEGVFIQMRHLIFENFSSTVSKSNYYNFFLDARKYFKTYQSQALAVRFLTDQRYHNQTFLPLYSYADIGGKEFVRGYFEGTYRDNHLLGFEAEYRIPIWQDPNSKIWQFWRRTAVHFFASTAQVMSSWEDFELEGFRTSIGIGGRYVLNFPQKINLRVDIGYGLHKGATLAGRGWGFYFFIGEAF